MKKMLIIFGLVISSMISNAAILKVKSFSPKFNSLEATVYWKNGKKSAYVFNDYYSFNSNLHSISAVTWKVLQPSKRYITTDNWGRKEFLQDINIYKVPLNINSLSTSNRLIIREDGQYSHNDGPLKKAVHVGIMQQKIYE